MAKTTYLKRNIKYRNYAMNGDMAIAQRGTSFAAIANGAYSLDRYQYEKSGAAVHTISQDSDAPTVAQSGSIFSNSARLNLTTADTSIAAGDYVFFGQKIEGFNWANFAQKVFTVSFWVKATLPGTYCMTARNGAQNLCYVSEYTINASATWEYKTITVAASPSAGTWDYINGTGIHLIWSLAVGSTFQTPAGSWTSGNFLGSANQINGVNTGATDFRLTGIVINEGYEALPFRLFAEDASTDISPCQRHYEIGSFLMACQGVSGQGFDGYVNFKMTKRASPTVTQTNFVNISNATVSTASNVSTQGFGCRAVGSATALVAFSTDWTAESEL